MKPRLVVELVPSTCWYSNVRSEVTRPEWDRIRKSVYAAAGKCEICGDEGIVFGGKKRIQLECHERWHYDDGGKIQTLLGMVALCSSCHEVKHFGLAQVRGRNDEAFSHLMKVNNWDRAKANEYLKKVMAKWQERSEHEWELNIDSLKYYGIEKTA